MTTSNSIEVDTVEMTYVHEYNRGVETVFDEPGKKRQEVIQRDFTFGKPVNLLKAKLGQIYSTTNPNERFT